MKLRISFDRIAVFCAFKYNKKNISLMKHTLTINLNIIKTKLKIIAVKRYCWIGQALQNGNI